MPLEHTKLTLEEIQSLDLQKIVEHKARQAYTQLQRPVIVEDNSVEFDALGGLPGPFIKFFVDHVPLEVICGMIHGQSRGATARTVMGYFNGTGLRLFETSLRGSIAQVPAGANSFGWDKIFIPDGYTITRAQMDDADYQTTYLKIKPLAQVKEFLLEG